MGCGCSQPDKNEKQNIIIQMDNDNFLTDQRTEANRDEKFESQLIELMQKQILNGSPLKQPLIKVPKYLLNEQTETVKQQILDLITEGKSLIEIQQLQKKYKISFLEQIGIQGQFWTPLHFAAYYGETNILKYFLQQIYNEDSNLFEQKINTQTKEGWSPLMVAIKNNQLQVLELMFKFGGIYIDLRDQFGKNINQIAIANKSFKCLQFLQKNEIKKFPVNSQNIFSQDEQQQILISAPPIISNSNNSGTNPKKTPNQQLQQQLQNQFSNDSLLNNISYINQQKNQKDLSPAQKIELQKQNNQQLKVQNNNNINMSKQIDFSTYSDHQNNNNNIFNQNNKIDILKLEQELGNAMVESYGLHGDKAQRLAFERENKNNIDQFQPPNNMNNFQKIVQALKPNSSFSDPDFPHSIQSLCGDKQPLDSNTAFTNTVWLRPHQILRCDYDQILLLGSIQAGNIVQGSLGICYFLPVLASLADWPRRIEKLFNFKFTNDKGVYSLNLFIDGKQQEIIIDDYIPCQNDRREPLFIKPKEKDLWALLLEKAWSKSFGNYLQACKPYLKNNQIKFKKILESSLYENAIQDLTGAPTFPVNLNKFKNPEELFLKIQEFDQNNYIISCQQSNKNQELEARGISDFQILQTYSINKINLIKLRNNNENSEFKGEYENTSKKWTPELKATANFEEYNSGLFYLTPKEFSKYFDFVIVCEYKDNYKYSHLEIISEKNSDQQFIQFQIQKQTDVCIRLHQEMIERSQIKNYKYSNFSFMLYQHLQNGDFQPVISANYLGGIRQTICSYQQDSNFIQLDQGSYTIAIKMHWFNKGTGNDINQYVVSAYSDKIIKLRQVKETENQQIKNNIIKSKVNDNFMVPVLNDKKLYIGECFDQQNSRYIVKFQNMSIDSYEFYFKLKNSINAKLLDKADNDFNIKISLSGECSQAVVIEPIDKTKGVFYNWDFDFSVTYKISLETVQQIIKLPEDIQLQSYMNLVKPENMKEIQNQLEEGVFQRPNQQEIVLVYHNKNLVKSFSVKCELKKYAENFLFLNASLETQSYINQLIILPESKKVFVIKKLNLHDKNILVYSTKIEVLKSQIQISPSDEQKTNQMPFLNLNLKSGQSQITNMTATRSKLQFRGVQEYIRLIPQTSYQEISSQFQIYEGSLILDDGSRVYSFDNRSNDKICRIELSIKEAPNFKFQGQDAQATSNLIVLQTGEKGVTIFSIIDPTGSKVLKINYNFKDANSSPSPFQKSPQSKQNRLQLGQNLIMENSIAANPIYHPFINKIYPNHMISSYYQIWQGILIDSSDNRIECFENRGEKPVIIQITIKDTINNWIFLAQKNQKEKEKKTSVVVSPMQRDVIVFVKIDKYVQELLELNYQFEEQII